MPLSAERTAVRDAMTLNAGKQGGIQGVALASIPALPRARRPPFLERGFLH